MNSSEGVEMDLGIEISFIVTRRDGDTVYTVTARHHLGGMLWTRSSKLFDGHVAQRALNAMRLAVMAAIDEDPPSITAAKSVTSSSEQDENDEESLLPCPFCGGTARWGESPDSGHFIECSKCQSSTNLTYYLMDDASRDVRERWNRRVK